MSARFNREASALERSMVVDVKWICNSWRERDAHSFAMMLHGFYMFTPDIPDDVRGDLETISELAWKKVGGAS